MTNRWHHCCQMTVTRIQLKPSDLPGHSGAICPQRFLTNWGLLIWQEANCPLSTLIETQIASCSVPIKTLHTIPNFWFVPFTKISHETYLDPCTSDDQMKCKWVPKLVVLKVGGVTSLFYKTKQHKDFYFIICCLDTYLYSSCHLE